VWTDDGTADPAEEGLREALCTVGNGVLATRGALPECPADGVHYPGTYIAGCYNRLLSRVAGAVVENEDLVNVPNWLTLTVCLPDGEWLDLARVTVLEHRHELDVHRGVLNRHLRFVDSRERTTRLVQRRLVSLDAPQLAALETVLIAEDWSGRVRVRAGLDGQVSNTGVERYRGLACHHLMPIVTGDDRDQMVWLQVETSSSRIRIAQAARVQVDGEQSLVSVRFDHSPGRVAAELDIEVSRGMPIRVEKVVATYTSKDHAISESLVAARTTVKRAPGFDDLLAAHAGAWARLWSRSRITIVPRTQGTHWSDVAQKTIDLYVFHLLQTLSEHTAERDVGVPARGLHGEAYRGHVFWDELFVFPFLLYRLPDLARALLMYRWRRLPEARWAASVEGFRGAMYPWQSGSDGREESQRLHLNPLSGRWIPDNTYLQRHVGLAIAYNIWQYWQVTRDEAFLVSHGIEMLVEIARFFASLATYDDRSRRFDIRGVVGPDEYHERYPGAKTPGIDNNAYTNVMTSWMLRRVLDALVVLPPRRRDHLFERLGLSGDELDRWRAISRSMRVVFHGDQIISQFEGYDRLAELDWEAYRDRYGDIRRLDRILEAEGDDVNRYQVSKQADVLMLFFLLDKNELTQLFHDLGYELTTEAMQRTVDYYLARTAHGSSLSAVVHAWVLSRTDRRASWRFFCDALASDISDPHAPNATTREGIHLGAMAGCVDLLQRCYLGLEVGDRELRLNPKLPSELDEVAMTVRYGGHDDIDIRCTQDRISIELPPSNAPALTIVVKGQARTLKSGEATQFLLGPS